MAGRSINDHSFWAGKGSNGSVFPMGAKSKAVSSNEGAGSLNKYEDTEEAIKAQQKMGIGKAKGHPQKAHHRN